MNQANAQAGRKDSIIVIANNALGNSVNLATLRQWFGSAASREVIGNRATLEMEVHNRGFPILVPIASKDTTQHSPWGKPPAGNALLAGESLLDGARRAAGVSPSPDCRPATRRR